MEYEYWWLDVFIVLVLFSPTQVSPRGFVSFNDEFLGLYPRPFPLLVPGPRFEELSRLGYGMIAPLWTRTDPHSGHVYCHVYRSDATMDSEELQRYSYVTALARDDLETCGGLPGYDPTMVVVITWDGMEPSRTIDGYEVGIDSNGRYVILVRE